MTRKLLAFPVVATLLLLAGCAGAPSYESVAEKCGGDKGGVVADETGVMALVAGDGYICTIKEMLPDKSDQYTVTLLSDDGHMGTESIGGVEVKFIDLGGYAVFFSKE